MNRVKNEPPATYGDGIIRQEFDETEAARLDKEWGEDDIIDEALKICETRLRTFGQGFTSPNISVKFCVLQLANLESERFDVIFLNAQNQLIEHVPMFSGTINETSVYPREILKAVMRLNAAAVILAHNHPSGIPTPSQSDINITTKVRKALKLVDVEVLDHIIVGGIETYSFSKAGLI